MGLVHGINLILNGFHAQTHLWFFLNLTQVGLGRFDVVTGIGAWIVFLRLFFLDQFIERRFHRRCGWSDPHSEDVSSRPVGGFGWYCQVV